MERDTLLKAKTEGLEDRYPMFYDFKSEGKNFILCDAKASIKTSWFNSTIYIKGKFILPFNPFLDFEISLM